MTDVFYFLFKDDNDNEYQYAQRIVEREMGHHKIQHRAAPLKRG